MRSIRHRPMGVAQSADRRPFNSGGAGRFLIAVLLAVPAVLALPIGSASAAGLPSDPDQQGYIGFCNETGHNVTGGSVTAAPFVWKAVASTPPPASYLGRGENAVLNIYQPRPGVDPADWNGDSLTAASYFSTPQHPAVQATYSDIPLSVIIREFPPEVDGLYQLRMFFGRTEYGTYSATYPATTIRVVGNTWSVVSGGQVDCHQATSVSNEALTGVVSRREITPHKVAAPISAAQVKGAGSKPGSSTSSTSPGSSRSGSGAAKSSAGPTGISVAGPGGAPQSIGASPVASSHSTSASGSSGHGVLLGVGGGLFGVVVLAGASILFLRTRRTRTSDVE